MSAEEATQGFLAAHYSTDEEKAKVRKAIMELAEERATVLSHVAKTWESITFAGARHRLELVFEGAAAMQAADLFVSFLSEHEFAMPRLLVADACVTAIDHQTKPPRTQISCELLVLREG